MKSDNVTISYIRAMKKVSTRWEHLNREQKLVLLALARTADELSERFFLQSIKAIRRQKSEVV